MSFDIHVTLKAKSAKAIQIRKAGIQETDSCFLAFRFSFKSVFGWG